MSVSKLTTLQHPLQRQNDIIQFWQSEMFFKTIKREPPPNI